MAASSPRDAGGGCGTPREDTQSSYLNLPITRDAKGGAKQRDAEGGVPYFINHVPRKFAAPSKIRYPRINLKILFSSAPGLSSRILPRIFPKASFSGISAAKASVCSPKKLSGVQNTIDSQP